MTAASATRLSPLRNSSDLLDHPSALRREASEHGYLFFRRLIESREILDLRRHVLGCCRDFGWLAERTAIMEGVARPGIVVGDYQHPRWAEFQCRVLPLPEFRRLGASDAVVEVLGVIFGGPVDVGRGDVCRVFSPRSTELTTPPHQDQYYVGGTAALWTVWIPLGDCPIELGGLAILPGSHRQGLRQGLDNSGKDGIALEADVEWASAHYGCGDVLMFSGLTIHKALENDTTNRLRVSADFRYAPAADTPSRSFRFLEQSTP